MDESEFLEGIVNEIEGLDLIIFSHLVHEVKQQQGKEWFDMIDWQCISH